MEHAADALTGSTGVAIRVSHKGEPRGLLRDANLATYTAKKKDKNHCEVYCPSAPTRRSG